MLACCDRGGRIRTGEPPRPKRGALTRLSYAPVSEKCTDCVTVRADQLALRDFLQQATTVVTPSQVADIPRFRDTRRMVELHCRGMKDHATIGARSILEALIPRIPVDLELPLLLQALPRRHALHQSW